MKILLIITKNQLRSTKLTLIKDTLKAFDDVKNKQKSV